MGPANIRFYAILVISALAHASVAGTSMWMQTADAPVAVGVPAETIAVEFVELQEDSPPEPDPTPEPKNESPQEEIIGQPSPTPQVAAAPAPDRPAARNRSQPKQPSARMTRPAVVEARPDYLINPPPPYPAAARRRNLQGTVLLRANISENGTVASLRVSRSSGHNIFDRAALTAVRKWKFSPRRVGGVATPGVVEVPVQFRLK